jgi:hypothetical protein
MSASATLLLIERILPERIDPEDVLARGNFLADINMFVNPGLRLKRVISMPIPQAVMEVEADGSYA